MKINFLTTFIKRMALYKTLSMAIDYNLISRIHQDHDVISVLSCSSAVVRFYFCQSLQFRWSVLIILRPIHVPRGRSNAGDVLFIHGISCFVECATLLYSSCHFICIWKLCVLSLLAVLTKAFRKDSRLILPSSIS